MAASASVLDRRKRPPLPRTSAVPSALSLPCSKHTRFSNSLARAVLVLSPKFQGHEICLPKRNSPVPRSRISAWARRNVNPISPAGRKRKVARQRISVLRSQHWIEKEAGICRYLVGKNPRLVEFSRPRDGAPKGGHRRFCKER